MPSELEISISPAQVKHCSFVMKAILFGASFGSKSFDYDRDNWSFVMEQTISDLLKRGSKVLVAHSPTDPDLFFGFIFYEEIPAPSSPLEKSKNGEPKVIVHWVYTKDIFRQQGIMKALLLAAGIPLEQPVVVTIPSMFQYHYKDKLYHPILNTKLLPLIAQEIIK